MWVSSAFSVSNWFMSILFQNMKNAKKEIIVNGSANLHEMRQWNYTKLKIRFTTQNPDSRFRCRRIVFMCVNRPDCLPKKYSRKQDNKQECIPVGCVPPVAVAIHGGLPQCMLGYPPQVWAWRPPPQVWAWNPPGCGPGDSPAAKHAGIPPAMHAGIPTPPWTEWLTDRCKNITFAACGR